MKRKYALAAVLVGTLVLPLFGCQKYAGGKFELRYGRFGKDDGKTWNRTDNYYALLFRDEPAAICKDSAEEFFGVDCIAKAPVFQ